MKPITSLIVVAGLMVGSPTAASAALLSFGGSVNATAVVTPSAGCAPLPFQGVATGTGSSNLGGFAYSHTVCTQGATGPVTGSFLANFGVDQFQGTLNGSSVATATTGIFDQTFNFSITAGTGRFLGATGSFDSVGTVDARNRPSQINFNLQGLVNASAVPEPATWAMMLGGFGMVGWAMRSARRKQKLRVIYTRLEAARRRGDDGRKTGVV
jgi:hypothetical protein